MKDKKDYHAIERALDVLGLKEPTTCAAIKKAYYRLAREYHPDMCSGKRKKKNEERFKQITRAYKVVRAYCDTYGGVLDKMTIQKNILGKDYYDHIKRFYDGWWGDLDM
jgi:DnaJ-class molecular chaperone